MSAKSQRYWKKYGIDDRSERVEEQNVSFQVFFSWISSEFIYKIFFIFLLGVLVLIIGIWVKICVYIGAFLFLTDVLLSLFEQMKSRKTVLKNNDPNFEEFQNAVLSPDWENNVKDFVKTKISGHQESTEEQCRFHYKMKRRIEETTYFIGTHGWEN